MSMEELQGAEAPNPEVVAVLGRLATLYSEVKGQFYLVAENRVPGRPDLLADILSQTLDARESIQFGLVARTPAELAAAQADPKHASRWVVLHHRGRNHERVTTAYHVFGAQDSRGARVEQPKDERGRMHVVHPDPASKRWNNLLGIITRTEKAVRR